jgi:hypothetical protein
MFHDYRPQKVTFALVWKWLSQYSWNDQKLLRKLLRQVIYLSEDKIRKALVETNAKLLKYLKAEGLKEEQIIYVSIDDAGSSSPAMLNLLRDIARLQKGKFLLLDSKNTGDIFAKTSFLGEGAIVYVDDFSGTGDQFEGTRLFIAQYIVGNFTEFFLAPCVCEEAKGALENMGIQPRYDLLHTRAERPLLDENSLLTSDERQRLIDLSIKIDRANYLGYGGLATMVVAYINAPDSTPPILRGSIDQQPFIGVLPRTTDLPQI